MENKNIENINKEQKNFVKSLYGLRALAISMVVGYHFIPNKLPGGYLGVVIFLVLSSYLISGGLIKEIEENEKLDLKNFYRKRIIKIYKPLIAMLTLTSLFVLVLFPKLLKNYDLSLISSLFGLNNIYQIRRGLSYFDIHGKPNPLTHLWFLGLEIQFYLIMPILLKILKEKLKLGKKPLTIIFLGLSLASAFLMARLYKPGIDLTRLYYSFETRSFSFFIGSLLAINLPIKELLANGNYQNKKITSSVLSLIFLLPLLYGGLKARSDLKIIYEFGMYAYSIVSGLLIILLVNQENLVTKILSKGVFIYLGQRSYSLYLYHYPVHIFLNESFKFSKIEQGQLLIIKILATLIISEISYRLFEKEKEGEKSLKNKRLRASLYSLSFVIIAFTIFVSNNEIDRNNSFMEKIKELTESQEEKNRKVQEKREKEEAERQKLEEAEKEKTEELLNSQITLIGDSVMLSASSSIREVLPNAIIDAKVSRQGWDLPDVLESIENEYGIGDIVIIHLGTNMELDKEAFKGYLESLGERKIFLMNTVVFQPWEESVNKTLLEIAKEMENIEIIDWHKKSKGVAEYFTEDATHPNETGSKAYAELIKASLIEKLIEN